MSEVLYLNQTCTDQYTYLYIDMAGVPLTAFLGIFSNYGDEK